jgi:hypothetical protein
MLGLGVNKLWTSSGQKDEYAVLSQKAPLVAAFDDEYYRSNGSQTTFSNLITHSRTSNATMVDSDGLIKWAPHNLVTYSEDYTAGKSSNNITLTSGVADPLGGTNAYTLTATAINGFFRGSSSITVVPQTTYTVAVFSKNVSGTIKIGAYDLTNGAPITSSELTNSTNEWALEFHEFTTPVGCTSVYVYAAQQTTNGASYDSFGFHAYRSDLGGMVNNPDRGDSYVPTTSSAVYLPRRGHHVYNGYEWVNEGVLAESEARTNLEISSNRGGTKGPVALTYTTGEADVTGNNNAGGVLLTTDNAQHYLGITNTTTATSGNTYTISMFIKPRGNQRYIGLAFASNAFPASERHIMFDVDGLSIAEAQTNVTGTIVDFGGGWYRISMTATADSAVSISQYFITFDDAGAVVPTSYVGSTSDGAYFYGVQLEAASTPSSYIPTSGSTVTRAAETFTIPSANLPWPTPQYIGDELVTNGTFDTDTSGWSNVGGSIAVVSGELEITNGSYSYGYQSFSTTVGNTYIVEWDARVGTAPQAFVSINNGGTELYVRQYTSSATLVSFSKVFVATGTTLQVRCYVNSPTSGHTAYFDNISVREINPLSVSIQMAGRMTYADTDQNIEHIYYQWQEDANNEINGYISTSTTRTGKGVFRQIDNAILDVAVTSDNYYSPDILVPYNIASRHGSTFVNGAVDGVALTADTTPTALPDLSSTDLDLAYDYNGTIKTFRIWDKDLGDTGIAKATE